MRRSNTSNPCRSCRRIAAGVRWGFATLLIAGLLGGAGRAGPAGPTPVPVPLAASLPAASAPASVPASGPVVALPSVMAASSVVISNPDGLRLLYKTVPLPSGRVGVVYGPRQVVQGGAPPYSYSLIDGKLPAGLELSPDGRLGGMPTAPGTQRFLLQVRDAATPPVLTQQVYTIYVDSGKQKPAAAPASAVAPTPPMLNSLSVDDAAATVSRLGVAAAWVYKLTADDVKALSAPEATPADALGTAAVEGDAAVPEPLKPVKAKPEAPAEVQPSAEQLQDLLAPLVDIEVPTRPLFERALEARRCAYFGVLMKEAAKKRGASVNATCPPPGEAPSALTPAKSASAPDGDITPAALYEQLLPPGLKKRVITSAGRPHEFGDAQAVRWSGGSCGCVPPKTSDEIYGIYPFWMAGGAQQSVNFSRYTRISYLGALLNDAGGYTMAPHWDEQGQGFTRMAQRHGTKVDLMLYRRDWHAVLAMSQEQQESYVRLATAAAVQIVDTPLTDTFSRIKPFVLPFWSEPSFVFDGITVFFDELPTGAAESDKFRHFFRRFMEQLIVEMQSTERSYALNIVMPDHLFGEDGAYNFADLLTYLEAAEPPGGRKLADGPAQLDYKGKTDIRVAYLVVLSAPTSDSKRRLRAKIDNTDAFQGHKRVAFLNSVMPVLLLPSADAAPPADKAASGAEPAPVKAAVLTGDMRLHLDTDLAYTSWQFGGVGLWPLPVEGLAPSADVADLVTHNYYRDQAGSVLTSKLCTLICPNRTAFRLLFGGLLLSFGISIALYAWVCQVRSIGRPYVVYLWLSALLTVVVGFALLSCDPDLNALRTGNYILYALIALLFAAGAYVSLKPRAVLP